LVFRSKYAQDEILGKQKIAIKIAKIKTRKLLPLKVLVNKYILKLLCFMDYNEYFKHIYIIA